VGGYLKQMQVCGGVEMKAVGNLAGGPSVGVVSGRRWKAGVSAPSFLAAVGLLLLAIPASQPAKALDTLSLAGVNKAFETAAPAKATRISMQGDAAIAALREFVGNLSSSQAASDKADDYAGLRAYAAGLGSDQVTARQADEIQVAQATAPKTPKAAPAKVVKATPSGDAMIVGSKVCLTCHATQAAAFSETLMGRINKKSPGKFDCENCHGPGSLHVKAGGGRGVGGIISFRPDDTSRSAQENNAICLGCHQKGDRTYWDGSHHEARGLQCTNCHTVMRNVSLKHNLKTAWEPETCFQCHKDRRAQLYRSSHMPMREGKMVCSDCHNPHGSTTDALLRESSINDTCYKCHADKRGPFLFEHIPVRENCANCHEPHGSVNEYMLKVSRPRLCSQCHTIDHGSAIAGGPAVIQGFARACNNCHTQVHGSNSPSGALLLR
jgi:DmsE family decaheme c-type cytochrome